MRASFAVSLSIMETSYTVACNQRFNASSSYAYAVESCVFSGFSQSDNGGAININSITSNLTIKGSLFSSCYVSTSSYYGGAIFFNGSNFVMNRTCGQRCTAYTGQFFTAITQSTSYASEVDCHQCPDPSYSTFRYTIYFAYGSETIRCLNSSFNSVQNDGGALTVYTSNSTKMIYLNINNCSSSTANRVFFVGDVSSGIISYSNFANNCQATNDAGLVRRYGTASSQSFNITSCIFVNNSGGVLFSSDGNGTLYISSCWIAHSGYSVITGLANTSNCKLMTNSTFYFSANCLNTNGESCFLGAQTIKLLTSNFSSPIEARFSRDFLFFLIFAIE